MIDYKSDHDIHWKGGRTDHGDTQGPRRGRAARAQLAGGPAHPARRPLVAGRGLRRPPRLAPGRAAGAARLPPAAGPAHRPVMSGPVRWPVWDEGLWLPGTDSPCFPDRRRRWSTANSRGLRPVPRAVRLTSVRAPAVGGSLSSLTVRGPAGAPVKPPN